MSEVIKCFECGELFERLNCEHVCEPDQKARLHHLWYLQVERAARRDDFAAAALTGFLANSGTSVPSEGLSLVARLAIRAADAAIAELDKPQMEKP